MQSAAARVFDESNDVLRATKRIEILLDCLPAEDGDETGF